MSRVPHVISLARWRFLPEGFRALEKFGATSGDFVDPENAKAETVMLVDEKPRIPFRALSTRWSVDMELYWLALAASKRTVGIAPRDWHLQCS